MNPSPKSAEELLEMYAEPIRSHLLETAAAFDRIERAGGTNDPRLERLRKAGQIAVDTAPDRAARLLELLSD